MLKEFFCYFQQSKFKIENIAKKSYNKFYIIDVMDDVAKLYELFKV